MKNVVNYISLQSPYLAKLWAEVCTKVLSGNQIVVFVKV